MKNCDVCIKVIVEDRDICEDCIINNLSSKDTIKLNGGKTNVRTK